MLTAIEKNKLYDIITSVIGENASLRTKKHLFNEQTVNVVKDMIKANKDCNEAMKSLATNLMHVSKISASRWVKRAFTILKGYTEESEFNGLACRNTTALHWKTAIEATTI